MGTGLEPVWTGLGPVSLLDWTETEYFENWDRFRDRSEPDRTVSNTSSYCKGWIGRCGTDDESCSITETVDLDGKI